MKQKHYLIVVLLFSWFLNLGLQAQEASPENSGPSVEITRIEIKNQTLDRDSPPWTKVICEYETKKEWLDGITFGFEVLLTPSGEGKQKPRIAQGRVAFANIPAGKNLAIIYISPGTVKRFGLPKSINVTVFSGETELGSMSWPEGKKIAGAFQPSALGGPLDWLNQYNRVEGILLPLRFTPFLLTDYNLMPDPVSY